MRLTLDSWNRIH